MREMRKADKRKRADRDDDDDDDDAATATATATANAAAATATPTEEGANLLAEHEAVEAGEGEVDEGAEGQRRRIRAATAQVPRHSKSRRLGDAAAADAATVDAPPGSPAPAPTNKYLTSLQPQTNPRLFRKHRIALGVSRDQESEPSTTTRRAFPIQWTPSLEIDATLAFSSLLDWSPRLANVSGASNKTNGVTVDLLKIDPQRPQASPPSDSDAIVTITPITRYADLPLPAQLQTNLSLSPHHTPTPLQQHLLPAALAGHSIVATSVGGSSTAAYLTPLLAAAVATSARVSAFFTQSRAPATPHQRGPYTVVLAPARATAARIEAHAKRLAQGVPIVRTCLAVGSAPRATQLHRMRRGCQVLVGTPNRVWSLVEGVSGGGGAGPMEDLCCAVVSVLLVDAPLLVREGGWRNAVRCVERFRRRRKDAFGITPEERKPLQVIVTADSQLDEEVRRLVLAVAGEGVIRITGSATNHVSRTSARKGTTSTTAKHQKPPPEIAAASSEALNHTIPSAPPSTGLPRLPTTARYTLMWVEQPTQKHVLLRRVLHNPQFFPPPSSAVPPGASTRSSARSALVFVLDSAAADEVAEFLVGNVGVEAESLTAHASESEQAALVGLLNSGRVQALVVAEAGVDLGRIRCQAEVVINFDMPTSCEVFALRAEMSRPSNESATPYGRVVSFVSACSRSLFGSLIRMLETLPTKSVSKIPSQMKTVL